MTWLPKTVKDWVQLALSVCALLGALGGGFLFLDRQFVSEAELEAAFDRQERLANLRFSIEAARDRISKMDEDDPDLSRERIILSRLEDELTGITGQ